MSTFSPELDAGKNRSLRRGLLFWFLILSLLPMSIISWISFQQAEKNLSELVMNRLEDTAKLKAELVENWFDDRFIDLNRYANSRLSSALLGSLSEGFELSGLSLNKYTQSHEWIDRVIAFQGDLVTMYDHYDYIQNILLIDPAGNILYSVENHNDLGTNALVGDGVYVGTLFSEALSLTLKTESTNFSDRERLALYKHFDSVFITAPVINQNGSSLGAIAIQLSLDRVFTLLEPKSHQNHIYQYILNQHNDLLTPVRADWKTVLPNGTLDIQKNLTSSDNSVKSYINPIGKEVLGLYNTIKIQNTSWTLVSEEEKQVAFSFTHILARVSIIMLLITALIVIGVAYVLSRRISKPIIALADASRRAADGGVAQKLETSDYEELAHMGRAFNHMLDVRIIHEAALYERTNEAQMALELLETQRAAIDQHAVVSTTDENGLIISVNDKFCLISGYSHDELVGLNHRILKSGFHPPSFYETMWKTISAGRAWHGIVCNKTKDGQIYWVNNTVVPFLDGAGKPTSYMSICTDISKSKQVEQALKESQKRLNLVIDATDAGIWDWQVQSGKVRFNARWVQLTGYSLRELGATDIDAWQKLIKPSDLKLSQQLLEQHWFGGTDSYSFELRMKHKEGHWVWVQDTGKVVEWDEESRPLRMIGTSVDISMRKEAEQALIDAKNSAEEAALAKSDFLASMSHEIRTPMNGVLGMLGLLKQSTLTSEQLQRVNVAQSSGQSLLSLINDILDFSKIEANKLELEIIDFNLHSMLSEFTDTMAYTAQAKGLELILDTNNIEESMVRGDPSRLRQVLTNLVGNAIKFTAQGEIVIRAKVEIISNQSVQLSLTVTDTGIGIPKEKQTSLFDSFSQVDTSTTREYGGTGLGLTIVKRLCELMEGSITLESKNGEGSTFEIMVLLGKSEESEQIVPQIEVDKLNILIVDDNATNRQVLRGQLEIWGVSVTEASSGEQALSICDEIVSKMDKENFFDIALLDMQMPKMDGETLGKRLVADQRFNNMKLIMMTSMASHGDAKKFTDLGFSAYFSKPTSTSDLFNALATVSKEGQKLQGVTPLVTHELLQTLSQRAGQPYWAEGIRILLVDDNHINQMVAQGILNDLGLQADIANHGKDAIESLMLTHNTLPYSLILMDCQMPEMDGYEATRAIRSGDAGEQYKDVPIVAMTANAMQGDRDKCIAAGMDDYLSKPVNSEILLNKLKQYLKFTISGELQIPSLQDIDNTSVIGTSVMQKNREDKRNATDLTWDKEGALIRIGGNEALLKTLAGIFTRDAKKQLIELKTAISKGEFQEATHLAHSIKGVAANLGGLKLQSVSATLELAAKNKDAVALDAQMPDFEGQTKALINIFDKYLESVSSEPEEISSVEKGSAHIGVSEFTQKMAGLYKSLEANDYIDPTELTSLSHADVAQDIKILVESFVEKIKQFENSTAMTILREIESLSGFDISANKGEG